MSDILWDGARMSGIHASACAPMCVCASKRVHIRTIMRGCTRERLRVVLVLSGRLNASTGHARVRDCMIT
eukprot:5659237-Alexandrium_andersonii.AAC.1